MQKFNFNQLSGINPSTQENRLGPIEIFIARWLNKIKSGRLTVIFSSGHQKIFVGTNDGPTAEIRIHKRGLVYRMILDGDIGVAESYMRGEWDTPDLTALLTLGVANEEALAGAFARPWFVRLINRLRHVCRSNTHSGSRKNIAAHYDLGNKFYSYWLDNSMSYSSALFESFEEQLSRAQRNKFLRLAKILNLMPGDKVLEIGCGWGSFAQIAAEEFGCNVVGLTLSQEQANYARERANVLGLNKKVDVRIEDYRDVRGKFDKIVSIEMFEAVGENNWLNYFRRLDSLLNPGGGIALQTITISDKIFDLYRRDPDFIQRYIFPGGMLPSPSILQKTITDAGMKITDTHYFGNSYAETLRCWHSNFTRSWPQIKNLGFDARFERMWRYYLSYCEAGFENSKIDVGQFLIERE